MTKQEYLKHKKLIDAWASGAEIEFKNLVGEWIISSEPNWFEDTEYRVKSKPNYLELYKEYVGEYIPFAFEDDLVGIKVKRKEREDRFMILAQYENEVFVGVSWQSATSLLKDYVFLDGSPCGKIKQ